MKVLGGRASMLAWRCAEFGRGLELSSETPPPRLEDPSSVLIRVSAAGLNPIDRRLIDGYGATLLGALRQLNGVLRSASPAPTLPLIPGRDVAGEVVAVGATASKFRPGQRVYGVLPPSEPGSLAELAVASEGCLAETPEFLSDAEAACLPYAALTAAAALRLFAARPCASHYEGTKVLVHGATGGLGTAAVQLLRAWGASVVGTCSEDGRSLVESLGASPVVYTEEDAWETLLAAGPYDVVLDGVGSALSRRSENLLGIWRRSAYVALDSPLLSLTDRLGVGLGAATAGVRLAEQSLGGLGQGRLSGWAFFVPHKGLWTEIAKLVAKGKLRPVLQKTVTFGQAPDAVSALGGHGARGKTVVDVSTASDLLQTSPAQ